MLAFSVHRKGSNMEHFYKMYSYVLLAIQQQQRKRKKTGIQCDMCVYGVENEIGFSCISNGDMKYNNVSSAYLSI